MKKDSAVILFSGGQDSTTCLYWALEEFEHVEAIGFDYGQMHSNELKQAQKITSRIRVPYTILNLRNLLGSSSLTDHSNHNEPSKIDSSLPASFVPGRNLLFITVGASWAAGKGITDIVTGVCETDSSGYPDCRRETMTALERTLTLGVGAGEFCIHTPLMWKTKAEVWKMAKDLGCLQVIVEDTLTDYNGDMTKNEWGYGQPDNPASILRMRGFYEAKERGWI